MGRMQFVQIDIKDTDLHSKLVMLNVRKQFHKMQEQFMA